MPVSLRLAIRQWLARPLRPILCSLAIAAAVALIVGVGAGFDSLRATVMSISGQVLGRGDVHVRSSTRGVQNRMPAAMLAQIRAHPEVALASGRLQNQIALQKGADERVWFQAIGIDVEKDEALRPKTYVAGHAPRGADELVIDENVAQQIGVAQGDKVTVVGDAGKPRTATIVGILKKPQLEMLQKPTLLLPLAALIADTGMPAIEYSVIDIKLKGTADGAAQDAYAKSLGEQLGKSVTVTAAENRKNMLAKSSENIDFVIMILSLVSGICAALIISTTLSVGVQERLRQFGQLRCIGASRGQMIQFLAADALLLMLVGIVVGLAGGAIGSRILIQHLPQVFAECRLETKSILWAIFNGVFATAIGAAIPAWQVARITPMEAVRAAAKVAHRHGVWRAGAVGVVALALQALLWLIPDRDVRFWTYVFFGIPAIFAGYCLVGPAVLLGSQAVAARVLGTLLFVRPTLLRQAWSRTPWRSGAMIAALMIGVVIYTTVQQRSEGLLVAWDFPTRFPDLLLFNPFGMPQANGARLTEQLPGVTAATEMAVVPARLKRQFFGPGRVLPNNATRFVGIDPDTFSSMVEMEFLQGNAAKAMERLKLGHAVLISQEFNVARGVSLGDKLPFVTASGENVDFEVAGVVRSSGMEMAQSYFDARGAFADESISAVVGTLADAQACFGARGVNMILLSVRRDGRTSVDMIEQIRPKVRGLGWQAASVIEMKEKVSGTIRRIVDALSAIAVAAMVVASLGVANMVIASVQARKYEFGILRAIGTGRGQLVRMILAEVTLVSIVAAVLGSLAGLHLTFMSTRVDRLMVGFTTPFVIWWPGLAIGLAITITLGWLSALVPAVRTAFRAQRSLLAAGRG